MDAPNTDLVALVEDVLRGARAMGDSALIVERRRRITGAAFERDVQRTTLALARRGLATGDMVLFGVLPGIECFTLSLACMRLGATVTFVDPGVGPELFARRVQLLRPTWVMANSLLYAAGRPGPLRWYVRRAGLELPDIARLPAQHVHAGPAVPWLVPRGASARSLRRSSPRPASGAADPAGTLPSSIDPDTPSAVIFTSGTTDEPKGVQHSAGSVTAAMRMLQREFRVEPGSIVYAHTAHAFIAAALHGATLVVSPLQATPERVDRDLRAHQVTDAFLLPVDAWRYALHLEQHRRALPSELRRLVLFSAPVTTTVLDRLHGLPGGDRLQITCAYAMTELLPVAMIDSREKLAWQGDGDVVGRPVAGVDARVDEHGELLLRGPNQQLGYLGMERTEWHATGDLARLDDEGRIVLLGRAKDMIIRGDWNIYPSAYEDTIARISGVAAAAMVGVPDLETADEQVVLFVEPDPAASVTDLAAHVGRELRAGAHRIDAWALPDMIEVAAPLPSCGRSQKVDRVELRRRARQLVEDSTPTTAKERA